MALNFSFFINLTMEKGHPIRDNFVVHGINKPLVKILRGGLWVCPKQLKRGPETKNKTKIW
jgi:hypothetical protein